MVSNILYKQFLKSISYQKHNNEIKPQKNKTWLVNICKQFLKSIY